MTDFYNKYLKYKQKYINLKNIIGGGIDATYEKNGNNLILKYQLFDTDYEIKYKIGEVLGSGSQGIVYLINIDGDAINKYIFKESFFSSQFMSYNEGKKSELLKGIIEDDMIVLFQGRIPTDFLISTYNGQNLKNEYYLKLAKIKAEYVNTTTQILELLYKINSNNLFHNDIKLENITIKNDKVYLIDFGLLDTESKLGTLISMSYKSVINFCIVHYYNEYNTSYNYLIDILKNTDIFGFFYICLDLLCLSIQFSYGMLIELGINNFSANSIYKLFRLYYFILPQSKRTIKKLNDDSNQEYETKFPNSDYAKSIFGNFSLENENLFRYMSFIYTRLWNIIEKHGYVHINLVNFLSVLSYCLLPEFNYDEFKPDFNQSVKLLFLSEPILQIHDSTIPPDGFARPNSLLPPDFTIPPDGFARPNSLLPPDFTIPPDGFARPNSLLPPDGFARPNSLLPPDSTIPYGFARPNSLLPPDDFNILHTPLEYIQAKNLYHGTSSFYFDSIKSKGLPGKFPENLLEGIKKFYRKGYGRSDYVKWFLERQEELDKNEIRLSLTGRLDIATEYSNGARRGGEGLQYMVRSIMESKEPLTQELQIIANELIKVSEYPGIILVVFISEIKDDLEANFFFDGIPHYDVWEYICRINIPPEKLYIYISLENH